MSDSRPPTNFVKANAPPVKRGLAAVPSWMLSLLLHGGLVVVLAATLSSRSGGIVGDPNGDFRRIGIYVGHSGDGSEGSGGGTSGKKAASAHQAAAAPPETRQSVAAPPPVLEKPVPPQTVAAPDLPLDTPTPDKKTIATAPDLTPAPVAAVPKPQPIIGPGPAVDTPVVPAPAVTATVPTATNTEPPAAAATSRQSSRSRAKARGKWDGVVYDTRGSAGGSGGGPRGSYGTAPFFGIWDAGSRFVYVIDCSGSMYSYNSMQAAKSELLSSLASLRRSQQFQIVFYNLDQKWMKAPGKPDFQYFPANESNRRLAAHFVAEVQPQGGTLHLPALKLALKLHPDVIFFLTDAGEPAMKPEEMEEIHRLSDGHSRIHCVQFGMHDDAAADFLRKLAADNNGDFAYQNVKRFAEGKFPIPEARTADKSAGEPQPSSLPGR
jgi:outer membrane biosynthesis protein TonB